MRASKAREEEKQNESNERARARGEREREEEVWFRRTDGRDGRNRPTNERTNERMTVWDGVSNQTLDTCDVITAAHIVHLITYQNLDRTVNNFPKKIEYIYFLNNILYMV